MADIQKALSLQTEGKLDEAEKIYLEFLKDNPSQPDVSNLLGLVYLQRNELDKALELFAAAVEGFACAEYYQNLGLAFFKKKEYKSAMQNFSKAIEFESNNVEIIRNFAQMAKTVQQTDYAIDFFQKVLALDPRDSVGWNNLGLMYEKKHEFQKAKECYIKSIKIKKNYEAQHNLGVLYRTLRNFDESIKCLKEALVLSPGNQETMISLGMSYLSQKDIQNGFRYYKFLNKETKDKYKNHWDGKKHPDSTLLVFYYAGYGDHIMFSRYLPFLKDYFKHIKVLLPISVSCLVSKNISGVEFVDSANVEYDYSTSILELPYLLGMDFENIPFSSGYLSADEKKVKEYREKYFLTDKKKIGLFWQGNPKVFANRSIKLEELEPILDMEDIQYYSFVKEDEKNQIDKYPQILNLGQTFKNFEDTAAAMMNLDLFVTIDSSVVHLAGALGVKTCLLLPYSSEWRWFKDEKKTPWYDSVTIYKQKTPYNWQNAVEEIQRFLEK